MLPYSKRHRPLPSNAAPTSAKPLQTARRTGVPIGVPTTAAAPGSGGARPQFDLNLDASLLNSSFAEAAAPSKPPATTGTPPKKTELTVLLSGGPSRHRGTDAPVQKAVSHPWHAKAAAATEEPGSLQATASKKRSLERVPATQEYEYGRKHHGADAATDASHQRMASRHGTASEAASSSHSSDSTDGDDDNDDGDASSGSAGSTSKHSDLSFSSTSSSEPDGMPATATAAKKTKRPVSMGGLNDKESLQVLTWRLDKERTKVAVYSSKLRRASRRIRHLSKQLESHALQLSIVATEPQEHKKTSVAGSPSVEAGTRTARRHSQHAVHTPPTMTTAEKSKQQERLPPPSSSSLSASCKPSYVLPLASNEQPELLRNLHTHQWRNAFSRKPRSLLFHRLPDARGKNDMDLICTRRSAMYARQIRCWKYGHQQLEHVITDTQLEKVWPETMSWITDHILAVGAPMRDTPLARQLSLVHFSTSSRHALLSQVQHLDDRPHSNGINVIEPLSSSSSSLSSSGSTNGKEQFSFATAGNDKRVVVWHMAHTRSMQAPTTLKSVDYIHKQHTSSIHALAHMPAFNVLYSGGADSRLVAWDLAANQEIFHKKLADRISHIHRHPIDPHLLLVTVSSMQDQLLLHDHRTPQEPVLTFGVPQQSRLSRYIAPSWHSDGYMVACGQQDKPHISIWDIRYQHVQSGPCQLIQSHDKRIIEVRFHPTKPVLGSISSDLSMNFMDFTL
ncbi:hypothetical protein SYNPS1DRAFT_28503 [Syncephalis pseudoplumigaleata]|uniref:Uncharacterized protein n=1 Tax=Syncephalis pseudoplumigaleata TaxID=1712513 RepID=A0A4P9Z0I6_9FUNG|nr:hypothetical protein SYNPS1DRAFT_28503 [Syncephalis pseudoplumigaleata]|eukprot:RKP25775.1 hypothetical protein SYNPS1DRAFT_28503 [Syncephalis pseudoplumigaleata]